MKKIIFTLTVSVLTLTAMAQPAGHVRSNGHHINRVEQMAAKTGYRYQLASFRTDDNYQFQHFYYDGQNRLKAVKDSVRNEYSVIDSLFYNSQNQMIKLSGWQLLEGAWKNVYYIDYTYDQAGNIASRTNYNNFGGEWNLGGVYDYTYNSDNQIVLSTLTMGNRMFQKIEYEYVDGRLAVETWYSYDGVGLYPSDRIRYSYNGNGLLATEYDSVSDDGNYWEYHGRRTYSYDNDGNCIEYHYYDYTGTEADRSIFGFTGEMLLSETLMPWTPEQERPKTFNNRHVYETEQWYTVDIEHTLQYVCDYLYEYVDNFSGIASPDANVLMVSPNPAKSQITISGLSENLSKIQIVDAMGRIVIGGMFSEKNNTIDVSMLPAGLYLLRTSLNGKIAISKLVIE